MIPPPAAPTRILVRAPNWVGDVVMATGSFADLRRSFPAAKITILIPRSRAGILAGGGYYDELIHDAGRSLGPLWRQAVGLRARKFDLAIVYPNSFRTALVARLAGARERVGFRDFARRWLLTKILDEPPPLKAPHPGPRRFPYPMTERFAALLRAVGAAPGDGRPVLAVTPECEDLAGTRRMEMGIAPGERLIGINPGANFGASKLWPLDRFARLADGLTEKTGRRTILFLGPGEEPIGEKLASLMRTKPVSTGRFPLDLDVLKPFVRDLDLLVTTDTGTRHYAVAFRVPVAVVMGSTHPGFTNCNLDETDVIRYDVPCGPCHLKSCPLDHRCMTLIEPEEVLERSMRLMERVRARGNLTRG